MYDLHNSDQYIPEDYSNYPAYSDIDPYGVRQRVGPAARAPQRKRYLPVPERDPLTLPELSPQDMVIMFMFVCFIVLSFMCLEAIRELKCTVEKLLQSRPNMY